MRRTYAVNDIKRKFAWLPVRFRHTDDPAKQMTLWLEHYYQRDNGDSISVWLPEELRNEPLTPTPDKLQND